MIIKRILVFIIFLYITVTILPVFSANNLICPGISIGDFKLGMSLHSIEAIIGEPDSKEYTEEGHIYFVIYKKYRLSFFFDLKTELVETISTRNPFYKTSEGIKVGSNIEDVAKFYPEIKNAKNIYLSNDIAFIYDSSGKIYQIDVRKMNIPIVPPPL